MQPPPTQALKGYVELLAVAELHSTTTFIIMIIAHNFAIVKRFLEIYSCSRVKDKEKPGSSTKRRKTGRISLIPNAMLAQQSRKINPYFQKFFRMVEFHSISRPAIRKQASKVLQTLDIFRLLNCISQQLPLSSPETLSSKAVLQRWSLAPQHSCTRSCSLACPAELCCGHIRFAGRCVENEQTAVRVHDGIDERSPSLACSQAKRQSSILLSGCALLAKWLFSIAHREPASELVLLLRARTVCTVPNRQLSDI